MATTAQINSLTALYVGYFDRAGDPSGQQYWIDQIDAGVTLSTIAGQFATSAEAKALYPYLSTPGLVTPATFVESIYLNLFNRTADTAGRDFWVDLLTTGKVSAADMIQAIINGAQGSDNTILNNKTEAALYFTQTAAAQAGYTFDASDAKTAIDGVTADAATVTAAKTATDASVTGAANVGTTFTLTENTDSGSAFVGTAGNDAFNAGLKGSTETLTPGDVIDGAGGTDTLNAVLDGTPGNVGGFRADNIEIFNINNQTAPATVDVGDSKGFTQIWSDDSNQNLTVTGVGDDATIGLRSTSNSMTVTFDQGAIKDGAVDIALMNAGSNPDLTVNPNFTANNSNGAATVDANLSGTNTTDVKAINISSMGSDNRVNLADTGSTKIDTLTISGTANTFVNAPISAGLSGLKTITSTSTGNVVVVSAGNGNVDQTVTFGAGNDRYVISNAALTGKDTVDLGAGEDEFELHFAGTGIDLTTANNANVAGLNASKGVETAILDVWATTAETVKFKASDITGINKFVIQDTQLDAGNENNVKDTDISGAITVSGVENADTFALKTATTGNLEFTKATGATTLNLSVVDDLNGFKSDLTDIKVAVTDKTNFDGQLDLVENAKVTLTGSVDGIASLSMAGTANKGTTLDASALVTKTANGATNTLSGDAESDTILGTAQNDVITGGAGDDVLTGNAGDDNITGGAGADVLTGGEGKDTFVYTVAADSTGAKIDTITDFVSGTDTINLNGVGIVAATDFKGTVSTLAAANVALTASDAIYIAGDALYVDTNGSADIDNGDMRIVVQNGGTALAELKAQDLGLDVDGVTFTANKAGFNTANTADSVEGVKTGNADDTINATSAQLVGSTVNGLIGTDTLNVTDALGAFTFNGTNGAVEALNLQAGATGTVTVGAGSSIADVTITGGTSNTVVLDNGILADVDVVGGVASDNVTLDGVTYDNKSSFDGNGAVDTLGLVTGSNIAAAAVSDFEILNIANGASVVMTTAQHNGFTSITGAGGVETVTLATPGTVTGSSLVENYVLANGTNIFTLGADAQNVTENGGANTVNIGGRTITSTFTGFEADDTLVATTNANITGSASAGSFGTLNLTGGILMTETQHDAFIADNGIVATGILDQVNIATGVLDSIVVDTDVEFYSIAEEVGGNDAYSVNGITGGMNVVVTAGNDAVTFGVTGTYTGTINGNGTVDDILSLSAGADIKGATINGVEALTLVGNGSYTMTDAQYAAFTGTVAATGLGETLNISTAATALLVNNAVENYVFQATGADTIAIGNNNASSINISAGGADVITLTNTTIALADTDVNSITGFTADDKLISLGGGTSFQSISAAGTTTVGADKAVIEINSSLGQLIAPSNAGGGAAEALIAAAIGDAQSFTAGQDATVIMYGNGNAYIYQMDVTTADADLGTGDIVIEQIATLTGVAADSLDGINFI